MGYEIGVRLLLHDHAVDSECPWASNSLDLTIKATPSASPKPSLFAVNGEFFVMNVLTPEVHLRHVSGKHPKNHGALNPNPLTLIKKTAPQHCTRNPNALNPVTLNSTRPKA